MDDLQDAPRRARALQLVDRHREYRSAAVDPRLVRPVDQEMGGWAAEQARTGFKVSVDGANEVRAQLVDGGQTLGPLVLRDDGKGGLWVDPAGPGGLPTANSLGFLVGLRLAGVVEWPAVIYVERLEKDVDEDLDELEDQPLEGGYTPTEADREGLNLYVAAVLAALAAMIPDRAADLARAGAGLGGLPLRGGQPDRIGRQVADQQAPYLAGFREDLDQGTDMLMRGRYTSRRDFLDGVAEFQDGVRARAELYGTGGGLQGWREGLAASAEARGTEGGVWVCTFGPGTCPDCVALHRQWMPWADIRRIWGQETQCRWRCNCGVIPAQDPSTVGGADLEAVDGELVGAVD